MSTKIEIKNNNGIVNTGEHNIISYSSTGVTNEVDWAGIEQELDKLLELSNSPTLLMFAKTAKDAAKEKSFKKFRKAASKMGEFGLEVLKELSLNLLAALVAKAILPF